MSGQNRILFAISFLIIISPFSGGVAFSQSVPFETIDRGEISYFNYGDPNFLGADMVIKDHKTWVWFWVRHTQGMQPEPPIPRVDFRREMALAVMLGFQTSGGGPGIEISSVDEIWSIDFENPMIIPRRFSKGIRVLVKDHREPGPLDVITNPYHIVKMRGNYPSVIFEHEPKGKTCTKNADCSPDEYCGKQPGDCQGIGSCNPRPQGCIMVYDPVCGCDGKIYGNVCEAAATGVSINHPGRCQEAKECTGNEGCASNEFCLFPEGQCSGSGTCTLIPDSCPRCGFFERCYIPVCGCDMKTYANDCSAYRNSVSIFRTGECDKAETCINSGGTVTTGRCCKSVNDFPNTCTLGPCGCPPSSSHKVSVCDCEAGKCFDGSRCVPLHAP